MIETFLKAKCFHQQTQPLSVGFRSSQGQWHENVLFGGEHRQQVEALEDESDVAAAQQRKLVVVHASQIVAIEYGVPAGCGIQSCQRVHQRGFAGTRRSHNRREFSFFKSDVDATQRMHRVIPGTVVLHKIHGCNGRIGSFDGVPDIHAVIPFFGLPPKLRKNS